MRYVLGLLVFLPLQIFAVGVSVESNVFNEYGESIPARSLKQGDLVTVLDSHGNEQEAEVDFVEVRGDYIELSLLDYSEIKVEKLSKNASRTRLDMRTCALPALMLAASSLPVADGAFLSLPVCTTVCQLVLNCGCIALGFLSAPALSPPLAAMLVGSCQVLETTGGIPACITTCLAIPAP